MNDTNKTVSEENEVMEHDEMRPEYDFTNGIRGKHYRAYREGHTVKVHQDACSVIVKHFTLEDGAVFLEPDVREYFPDTEAVNNALRGLIALFPKEQ